MEKTTVAPRKDIGDLHSPVTFKAILKKLKQEFGLDKNELAKIKPEHASMEFLQGRAIPGDENVLLSLAYTVSFYADILRDNRDNINAFLRFCHHRQDPKAPGLPLSNP